MEDKELKSVTASRFVTLGGDSILYSLSLSLVLHDKTERERYRISPDRSEVVATG